MAQIGSYPERIDILSLGEECYRRLKNDFPGLTIVLNGGVHQGSPAGVVQRPSVCEGPTCTTCWIGCPRGSSEGR